MSGERVLWVYQVAVFPPAGSNEAMFRDLSLRVDGALRGVCAFPYAPKAEHVLGEHPFDMTVPAPIPTYLDAARELWYAVKDLGNPLRYATDEFRASLIEHDRVVKRRVLSRVHWRLVEADRREQLGLEKLDTIECFARTWNGINGTHGQSRGNLKNVLGRVGPPYQLHTVIGSIGHIRRATYVVDVVAGYGLGNLESPAFACKYPLR